MKLELGGAGTDDFKIRCRMLIVGEGKNRRKIVRWMVDDKLATQLAVQSSESSSHESR